MAAVQFPEGDWGCIKSMGIGQRLPLARMDAAMDIAKEVYKLLDK